MSEALAAEIRAAFATVPAPADWALRGSNEGEEPFLVEAAFRGNYWEPRLAACARPPKPRARPGVPA